MNVQSKTSSSVIHLICGSTGSGKSTYANKLKKEIGAVYFSIDDWMVSLFGPDLVNPMDWKWISERALRCEKQIISTACSIAETGVPSILEIGLQQVNKRAEVASMIKERGCSLQTHFLDVDIEERWRRVQNRNSEKSETFRLEVSRDMFDFFESIWEQPNSSERISLNEVFSGSQHWLIAHSD